MLLGQGFRKLEHEQDRHTNKHNTQIDATEYITTAAFAGGNN